MKKLNWGIIAPGIIAHKFAKALMINHSALYGVASRSPARAEDFAKKYGIGHHYGSYEALLENPEIDIVYIANPHSHHCETILKALDFGKHVLCEKPMCVTAEEVIKCRDKAKEKNLFLMEALWTRFLPLYNSRLPDLINTGMIGEVRTITADYSFDCNPDPEYRLLNKRLAGGALLDVGVYALHFADMFLGKAVEISSVCHIGETGVDVASAISIKYEKLGVAVITNGIKCTGTQEGRIIGTKGYVVLPIFSQGKSAKIHVLGEKAKTFKSEYENGFQFQIRECENCIENGLTESKIMPLSKTFEITKIMDTLREQWGTKD